MPYDASLRATEELSLLLGELKRGFLRCIKVPKREPDPTASPKGGCVAQQSLREAAMKLGQALTGSNNDKFNDNEVKTSPVPATTH